MITWYVLFKIRNYTQRYLNRIKIKLLDLLQFKRYFNQEDVTRQEGTLADNDMEGNSEETADKNKRKNSDEDSNVFRKSARKTVV
jgi:outer membrane protein assembly factor BamE (lipoprotein component of BamABCDE complex)